MPEEEYRRVFVRKLKYYMNEHHKNQSDLMKDLGLSSSTISNWCTGAKLPRMDKIQMLADYFGIEKSDLIQEKSATSHRAYYLSTEESSFLSQYQELSDAGKQKLTERLQELRQLGYVISPHS